MIAAILTIFSGLAAIPKIGDMIKEFASALSLWYIQQANESTNKAIADAAAFAARAKTQEERHAALDKWKDALSRTRFIN